jgi:hypothetical protein
VSFGSHPAATSSHDHRTARLEFFLWRNKWRWRRDDELLGLVHAGAFFAPFFFENESMVLTNLGGDVGFDRLIDVGENVERHQLSNELMRFEAELRCQLFHDDRRLNVNDLLRLFCQW